MLGMQVEKHCFWLFRSLYRLYSRANSGPIKEWHQKVMPHQVNNASRRWVGDATWRMQARAQTSSSQYPWIVEIQNDITNAFENVARVQMVAAADVTAAATKNTLCHSC